MRRIKTAEYSELRNELNIRIQLMNTHNIGMITAVFAAWAIVGVLVRECFAIDNVSDFALSLYAVLMPFLLIVPLGIIVPLAVKSGDNFGQIMSISAYLMLYAEMPSLLNDKESFFGWESLQKKEIERKLSDRFFNSEYIILSAISLCFFVAVVIIILRFGFPLNATVMWIMLPVYLILFAIGVIGFVFIYRKSSIAMFLKRRHEYYTRYCESAKLIGLVSSEEIEAFDKLIGGSAMHKEQGSVNSEIIIKLREMMCSGKLYNPLSWRYYDGDVSPCGNVDCSEIMKTYQIQCRKDMEKYNSLPLTEKYDKKRQKLLSNIFGRCDCFRRIETPLHANYGGKHTTLRGMFYAGFNLTLIEDGQIEIGDKTMIGPNVTICTAEHPTDVKIRNMGQGILYNKKVTIGSNVWIGANVTILAGANIGNNCVIGANSIITRDTVIPDNKIAVGIVSPKIVSKLKNIK